MRPAATLPLTPGAEPELRIGLVAGAPSVTLGGDGELFITDDANGEPIGSIPAGTAWTVVSDTLGIRLVKPDGSRGERRGGLSAGERTGEPLPAGEWGPGCGGVERAGGFRGGTRTEPGTGRSLPAG